MGFAGSKEIHHPLDIRTEALVLHPEVKMQEVPRLEHDPGRPGVPHRRVGPGIDRRAGFDRPGIAQAAGGHLLVEHRTDLQLALPRAGPVEYRRKNFLGVADGAPDALHLAGGLAPVDRCDHPFGRNQAPGIGRACQDVQ